MFEILKLSPLFAGLEVGEINLLINKVFFQIRNFSNQEVLAFSGESVEKAMILLEGKLQGEMLDYSGSTLKIEEIDPPQMVAPAFLYGPQSVFPVNLSALSDGKMLIIEKKEFTRLLANDLRVLKQLSQYYIWQGTVSVAKDHLLEFQDHPGEDCLVFAAPFKARDNGGGPETKSKRVG